MEDKKNKAELSQGAILIPDEMQEEAKKMVKGAFDLFANHNQTLTAEIAEFIKRRDEIRQRIQSGVRRTSGHII